MQHHDSLETFIRDGGDALSRGPVALMFAEDASGQDDTIRHLRGCGFAKIVTFAPASLPAPTETGADLHRVRHEVHRDGAVARAVNRVIAAAPGIWLHYCYNAEFLFYPFAETRSVGEMLTFHAEERRDAMLTCVVDLYADDLERAPDGVDPLNAHFDTMGYHALARPGGPHCHPLERQLDFFGGLRWRFEEHVPEHARRIDRIGLFRAQPGLQLRPDHTFDNEEYNTYACPWHHNLTAAIASFRAAKALRTNPGSAPDVTGFTWHGSRRFEWRAQQLLDLGLIEPGQWF